MLTLHHLENSQSIRILWLLEEIGADYEFKIYDRDPKTMLAPKPYKALSPLGTAPVITDGEITLAETSAIVDYIVDRYADEAQRQQLRPPPNSPQRMNYLFWFHTAQGSFQPLLTTAFLLSMLKEGSPFFIRPIIKAALGRMEALFLNPRLEFMFTAIEKHLSSSAWFAGDQVSGADILMSYCMEGAVARAGLDDRYPNAQRYIKQLHKHPSYQKTLEKDGRFSILSDS